MKKRNLNFLIIVLIFLILIPFTIGAYDSGTYGAGRYSKGVFGTGEIITTPTPPSGSSSSSSSGGGGGGAPSCTYDWECSEWFPSECPASGFQKRICINKGTCTGTNEMPNTTRTCTYLHKEPLFDIFLELKEKEIYPGQNIKANIKLENYGKIELLDAFMTYWIVNENNSLIAELKDTRAVSNIKEFEISMNIPESTSKGVYKIYAQITYLDNKSAVAGESFKIIPEEEYRKKDLGKIKGIYILYFFAIIILIFVLIELFKIINKKRKNTKKNKHFKYREKVKKRLNKIKKRHYLIFTGVLLLLTGIVSMKSSLTGMVINSEKLISNNIISSFFILTLMLIGFFIFLYRQRIYEFAEERKERRYSNRIKSLINKKVYTEEGKYFGKVKNIILQGNKIYGLKIITHKGYKLKRVVVNYSHVKSVNEIVLIDNKISKEINKS